MHKIYHLTEPTDKLPAVIATFDPNSNNEDGSWVMELAHDVMQILEQQPEPVFYIAEADNMHMDLDDMSRAVKAWFIDTPLYHHAKLREGILVSKNVMYALAAKGLNTPIFGNVKIRTFGTLQEAIDYVRQAVPAWQPFSIHT